ncbi:hypothetical protein AQUCO_02400120v1 [Aquilegia coerulea]|uniref:Uncharacterized protein n=1 Tax=Aquilegia coerulea TaxID=218851 RepID=A0A2G5DBE6_AQUCA|nr:hypothetical protein AQUCO_02400120v1 [Aquilegia coerulea]
MVIGSSCPTTLLDVFVKAFVGYRSCITYTGVGSLCLAVMSTYVISYDPPSFGAHHFSLKSWGSAEQVRKQLKSPMWVNKLYQKQPLPDLETVIFAINSATSAMIVFESCLGPKSYTHQLFLISALVSTTCHLAAVLLASFFTLIYIILQFFHRLLRFGSQASLYAVIAKAFSHTWKNIYIRSCQLLYWPIRLQDSGFRSQSNVEYAHRAALHKHSMWSSVAVDVFLGNAIGFALLIHIDSICPWLLNLIHDITNNWLRSGCVWLMGVPAGFKLNTELAGILGMVSLNAIQIWSTLLIYMGFLFRYIIKGLALSGILSGLTVPAALIIDMIMLTTLHVSTLHWLISLLYSHQIKSLAALWRLFRGRKWNPLRQRFDSYDYTVKQHVIGSLLFTPLLLLLPTTSVFYIFFTILNTTISFICILIEVTISLLHATPYHEIFLWVVRPGRFPSGIWFDISSSQSSNVLGSPIVRCFSEDSSSKTLQQRKKGEGNNEGPNLLLLFLRTNFASIGQITLPHYRAVFHGVCAFSGSSSASGILTGSRIQAALQTRLPATMPWMCITCKEYWCLCFDSVLSCLGSP